MKELQKEEEEMKRASARGGDELTVKTRGGDELTVKTGGGEEIKYSSALTFGL